MSDLFNQIRNRAHASDGDINPFAFALTDVVTGGLQQFGNFCKSCGGGGGGGEM